MSDARRLIKTDGERLGHVPSFDGLRGLITLQVVMFHATLINFLSGTPMVIDWFFIASGFLITSLLLDEHKQSGTLDMRRFYSRRILRLFPAMYAMLGFMLVVLTAVHFLAPDALDKAPYWWLEILAAAFYVYFIVAAFFPGSFGVIGHTWSLTVEEQFYYVWPQVLGRTLKKRSRSADVKLVVGCLGFIALFMALRVGLQHMVVWQGNEGHSVDEGNITWQGVAYRIASCRPDMIVWGCLMAFVARAIPRPVPPRVLRILGRIAMFGWALCIAVYVFANRVPGFELFGGVVYQVAILLVGACVIDLYLRPQSWIARLVSIRPLRWLGVRCYGIYLWHVPVLLVMLPAINNSHGVKRLVLGTIATVLGVSLGVMSYRFIERRFLKLKQTKFAAPQDRFRAVVEAGPAGGSDDDGPIDLTPQVDATSSVGEQE